MPSTVQDPVIGFVNDVIEVSGDFDLFNLNVVAGQTYTISLRGSGATPLADPFLVLRNNALAVVKTDDDGGDGINSLITFTAAYTGVYVIDARAYPGSGLTGTYHVDVVQKDAFDESDAFGSATPITIGTEYYGFIDSAATGPYGPGFGEVDTFSITVEAGKLYSIEIAGGADYASNFASLPPGEIDSVIVVYGPDQSTVIAVNDDINFGNGDLGSGVSTRERRHYYFDVFSSPGPAVGHDQGPIRLTSIRSTRSTGSAPTISTSRSTAS